MYVYILYYFVVVVRVVDGKDACHPGPVVRVRVVASLLCCSLGVGM